MVSCGKPTFASRAKHRVTIQQPQETPDDAGGRSVEWVSAGTVWAIVEPMSGREIYASSKLQSRVDARITIRYQSELADTTTAAKRRLLYGGRVYNIAAIMNRDTDMKAEGTVFQQLLCTEGQPS